MIFEKLYQTIPANGQWPIGMAGNELSITKAEYPVRVELRRGGQVIGEASGVQPGDYIRGMDFDYFRIINGANSQEIGISVSSGSSGSNRVVGEVSVISGEVTRSKAGSSFVAGMYCAADVGKYSAVQLFNPVSTGKRLIVNQLIMSLDSGSGGGTIYLRDSVAAMGALFAASPNALSKLLGGGVSVAENRFAAGAVQVGTFLTHINVIAFESIIYDFREPIVVMPGHGVIVSSAAVTVGIVVSANFWEESI